MKERIWKYPLKLEDEQIIEMPENPTILCLQNQRGTPYIWAMVDPKAGKKSYTFITTETGHPIDNSIWLQYIGTYQIKDMYVFHVFRKVTENYITKPF